MDKPWKVVVAFTGIFAAGLVAGGLVALRIMNRPPPPRFASPEQFGPQLMKRFAAKLDLTDEQQNKIRPLILKAGEDLHLIRRQAWTNSTSTIDKLEADIAAQLTPEQKVKFDQLLAEQREKLKRISEERQKRWREIHPGEPPLPPR